MKERIISSDILKQAKVALKSLPDKTLLQRGSNLAEVLELQMTLSKNPNPSLSSIVNLLLHGIGDFHSYDHLASPEVYDKDLGFQYYYHAHYHNEREEDEHGHFHLFYDLRKHPMADQIIPADVSREKRVLTHLIAFSVNSRAELGRIFTINGWVADDVSVSKEITQELLRSFAIERDTRYPEVNKWLHHLVQSTLELSDLLVEERERVIQEKIRKEGETRDEVLQDKNFEVPSSVFMSVADWALALDEEAERRGVELLVEGEAA